ncbi:MAG: hypothetical protein ACQEQ7_09075 [Thermodesulfobacteriota bacterium]
MRKRITLLLGLILLATPWVYAAEQAQNTAPAQDPDRLLHQTAAEIRHILHQMDKSLKLAKDELSAVGLQGKEATAVLQKPDKKN